MSISIHALLAESDYTDLNSAYGALEGATEITLQAVLLVSVLVCLGFSLLCRILFRR